MPRPAVIRFIAPGWISWILPSLSRCMMLPEQVGDGGKPDMRMRAHVHALAGHEFAPVRNDREDEGGRPSGACHAAARAAPPNPSPRSRVRGTMTSSERVAGFDVAQYGIVVGKPAHDVSSKSFAPSWPSSCVTVSPYRLEVRKRAHPGCFVSVAMLSRYGQLVTPISMRASSSGAITMASWPVAISAQRHPCCALTHLREPSSAA